MEQQKELHLESAPIEVAQPDVKFMTKPQIERFIQHYQRITEDTLTTLTTKADDIFELDENRKITQYLPSSR